MALSIDYVARETAGNLRRNLLMTGAAVLTVAISLALVGGVLLLKQGVANATARWQGGVQLAIFMQPGASPGETTAVAHALAGLEPGGSVGGGQVKSFRYCNQDCALGEFRKMFANQPTFIDSVTASDLPPSYRVVPFQASDANAVGTRFANYPGVEQVTYAKQEIDLLVRVTHDFQVGFIVLAAVMLLSALMLILNTIRMAIFARRREVAVMKLVGATNWFIRIPFMLEGLVQGLAGAAVAFLVVFLGRDALAGVINGNHIQLFSQLVVSPGDAIGTGIVVLLVGAVIGAASSAVAVRRFLDV
jgi:cell division transport system permease protein